MGYEDRHETILLQLFVHPECSECFFLQFLLIWGQHCRWTEAGKIVKDFLFFFSLKLLSKLFYCTPFPTTASASLFQMLTFRHDRKRHQTGIFMTKNCVHLALSAFNQPAVNCCLPYAWRRTQARQLVRRMLPEQNEPWSTVGKVFIITRKKHSCSSKVLSTGNKRQSQDLLKNRKRIAILCRHDIVFLHCVVQSQVVSNSWIPLQNKCVWM